MAWSACLCSSILLFCCVPSLSHLIPKILLKESGFSCSSTFVPLAARWLIGGRYSRTASNNISLSEVGHEESLQCALEGANGQLTGWSDPVKLYYGMFFTFFMC